MIFYKSVAEVMKKKPWDSPKTSSDKKIKSFVEKIRDANKKSSGKNRKIVLIDPITFKPIISRLSKPSNGEYKKINNISPVNMKLNGLNVKKLSKELKKIPLGLFEPKPDIKKPKTRKQNLKPCKENQVRNPKTNRCVKIKV